MNFIILDEKIAGITVVGGLEGRHAEGRHTENLEDWCTKCGRVAAADADFVCFHPVIKTQRAAARMQLMFIITLNNNSDLAEQVGFNVIIIVVICGR